MLPKWETRLGGAQATMWTHCFAMTQAGRIEPTVQVNPKQYVCIQMSEYTPNFFLFLKTKYVPVVTNKVSIRISNTGTDN
jgi:hypothetical protein